MSLAGVRSWFTSRLRAVRGGGRARLVAAAVVALLAVLIVGAVATVVGDSDGDDPDAGAAATDQTSTIETTTTVPESTTTTLSPEQRRRRAVVRAYEAARQAEFDASAPPQPDPDHPALNETHTGEQLDEAVLSVESLQPNTALRFPEDSVFSVHVESIRFGNEGGVEIAHLEICEVTDVEKVVLATGEVLPGASGVRDVELSAVLKRLDGAWKLAELGPREPFGDEEVECRQD